MGEGGGGLLLSMRKRLIECINKGGSHSLAVKQDMTYNIYKFVIIIYSCLYLFSTKCLETVLLSTHNICFG